LKDHKYSHKRQGLREYERDYQRCEDLGGRGRVSPERGYAGETTCREYRARAHDGKRKY
jgi:hypothetical protein